MPIEGRNHEKASQAFALGEALRRARERAGLTRKQAAVRAKPASPDHSKDQLRAYEEGLHMPNVVRCARLCAVYGTTVESLLRDAGIWNETDESLVNKSLTASRL
jgi:transcriptional regulator with XRE-family HTH domain